MKHYYSIVAFATHSIQYQDPLVFIEPGTNVFTILISDVDVFLDLLRADGIRVDGVNQLDAV